jgi:hypothetical protein
MKKWRTPNKDLDEQSLVYKINRVAKSPLGTICHPYSAELFPDGS